MTNYKITLDYIPLHSGEYLSKLQEYDFLERGAFASIIHLCVVTNFELPENEKIYRRLGAFSEEEKKAINNVIEDAKRFISPIIERQQSMREARANAGRQGGRSKAQAKLKQSLSKGKAKPKQNKAINTDNYNKTNIKNDNDTEEYNASLSSASKKDAIPYEKIRELFNSIVAHTNSIVPTCRKIAGTRMAHVRARWRDELPTLDDWEKFFIRIANSSFLMNSNFTDFGWIINQENCNKILEDKYSDARNQK